MLWLGDMVTSSLASRLLEPLSHPWAIVSGGIVTAGLIDDQRLRLLTGVAWRLLRLLISL
ncbi:MAG: hypothetical protein ACM3O7_02955 [Acidobacteriota bacterium]